ncbi:conserved hypothetical protein [Ricinus communis]|uniref:Uncharacterized protein n=1 Tax=Ricinus communis TaxID=3988 RepID=B9TJN0_RICCO|nr:conserved hypothetical protein [Ricinus communis]
MAALPRPDSQSPATPCSMSRSPLPSKWAVCPTRLSQGAWPLAASAMASACAEGVISVGSACGCSGSCGCCSRLCARPGSASRSAASFRPSLAAPLRLDSAERAALPSSPKAWPRAPEASAGNPPMPSIAASNEEKPAAWSLEGGCVPRAERTPSMARCMALRASARCSIWLPEAATEKLDGRTFIGLLLLAAHLAQRQIAAAHLDDLAQAADPQLAGHQGLLRGLQADRQVGQHPRLQADGMLQAVHELVLVEHDLGLHGLVFLRAPARLHFLHIVLQLLHLRLRGLLRAQALLHRLARLVTLSRRGIDGHHQGIQGRHTGVSSLCSLSRWSRFGSAASPRHCPPSAAAMPEMLSSMEADSNMLCCRKAAMAGCRRIASSICGSEPAM